MNLKSRLKELADKSDHIVELGFFTTNKPQYGEDGKFDGMHRQVNPAGVAAAGVGVAGAVAGGAMAHGAILEKFGKHADDGFGNLIRATNPGSTGEAYKAAGTAAKGFWNRGVNSAVRGTANVAAHNRGVRGAGVGLAKTLAKLRFAV